MSLRPVNYSDAHRHKMQEELGVSTYVAADILRTIEKIAASDVREVHIKTDAYEIKVKR